MAGSSLLSLRQNLSFPGMLDIDPFGGEGPGSGSALNPVVLATAGVATLVATVVSIYGVFLQLKVYPT